MNQSMVQTTPQIRGPRPNDCADLVVVGGHDAWVGTRAMVVGIGRSGRGLLGLSEDLQGSMPFVADVANGEGFCVVRGREQGGNFWTSDLVCVSLGWMPRLFVGL